MSDYIKRKDALSALRLVEIRESRINFPAGMLYELRKLPAADVAEVRHGRWLPDYDYTEYDFDGSTPLLEPRKFQDGWQCSLCGQYESSETKYCPSCGAKMDGGEDDAAD